MGQIQRSTIIYETPKGRYAIPADSSQAFLKDFPEAKEVNLYSANGSRYAIPVDLSQAFLKDFPDAKLLSSSVVKEKSFKEKLNKNIEEGYKKGIYFVPGVNKDLNFFKNILNTMGVLQTGTTAALSDAKFEEAPLPSDVLPTFPALENVQIGAYGKGLPLTEDVQGVVYDIVFDPMNVPLGAAIKGVLTGTKIGQKILGGLKAGRKINKPAVNFIKDEVVKLLPEGKLTEKEIIDALKKGQVVEVKEGVYTGKGTIGSKQLPEGKPTVEVPGEGVLKKEAEIRESAEKISEVKKPSKRGTDKVKITTGKNLLLDLANNISGKGTKANKTIEKFLQGKSPNEIREITNEISKRVRSVTDSDLSVKYANLNDMIKQKAGLAKASPITEISSSLSQESKNALKKFNLTEKDYPIEIRFDDSRFAHGNRIIAENNKDLNEIVKKYGTKQSGYEIVKKNLSGKDYSKGLLGAAKDDLTDTSMGITPDPYKNIKKFLKENNLKLTDDEIDSIKDFTKTLARSGLSQSDQANRLNEYLKTKGLDDLVGKATVKKLSKSKYLKVRAYFQDSQIQIRKLQEQANVVVRGKANPHAAETRYPGRLDHKMRQVVESVDNLDKDMIQTAKKLNVDDSELYDKVNNYLIAKHAPERNAVHGKRAAGISDDEAEKLLNELKNDPNFGEIKRLATNIKKLSDRTLDILLEGEIISPQTHAQLRKLYKDYVPLNRVMDGDDFNQVLTGAAGFTKPSSVLKRAVGSERKVEDLMLNISSNLSEAITAVEKNRVSQNVLNFARNNPQLGLFNEVKPQIIGKGTGGKPIFQEIKVSKDTPFMKIYEKGKPVYLEIKDPVFAEAYKAVGKEQIPKLLNYTAGVVSRYVRNLSTRFNPEFAIPNIIRDTQELGIYMGSLEGGQLRNAIRAVKKQGGSLRDVQNALYGDGSREGAKLYKEMVENGGTTGGMALSSRAKVKLNLENIKKVNRSLTRRTAKNFVEEIDKFNQLFEDASRLTAYKIAKQMGMSAEDAAVVAKNSTINFNRMGKGGPVINAMYAFANASIQGSHKTLKAMRNPKVAASVIGSVSTAVFAVDKWNDDIDPDWRDKMNKWDRDNHLTILLPTEDEGINYIKIPVSWGIKPIKKVADMLSDFINGHDVGNWADITAEIATVALEAYNPVGGSNLAQAISPTITDVPADILFNTAWYSGKIKPTANDLIRGAKEEELPESEKYWKQLEKTGQGKLFINLAKNMYEDVGIDMSPNTMQYIYEQVVGGAGRFGSRVIESVRKIGKGELADIRSRPFINRFYVEVPEDRAKKMMSFVRKDRDLARKLVRADNKEDLRRKRFVIGKLEEFKESNPKERQEILKNVVNYDPKAYEMMKRYYKYQQEGLTYDEMQIRDTNNPKIKAQWVVAGMENLNRTEQIKKYTELKKKKIIDSETTAEMVRLGFKIKGE